MATVLIVDDETQTREILVRAVTREGHTAVTACNVPQAREVLLRLQPALLLLDIDMPGETGVELVFELRGNARWEKLPVIFVTAFPERSNPLQATHAGAMTVVRKPFRLLDIAHTVAQVLGERGESTWPHA